eukprot:TRINITY_DN5069_c0_g1_i1.p1 TRINITY_DN5069_c0_g1~~TRINITY_DN5069_c0_g1_i1.p1  ORF type:complete len:273 (+),score=62.30 TRINITY_DN5069_c0_g1_i1:103-819(+)
MQEPFHDLLEKKWISNVDLSAECDRELGIISAFNQQMAKSTVGAEIIDCYIVDNNRRINHEMQQQIAMRKNEHMRYLFHGTSFNNVDSIIQSGFQPSYNRRSAYGEGTYVAKSAGTASQYCRRYRRECAVYAVLVCSTVIGKCVKGKRDMSFRRGAEYDTFVDSVRNPNIFVINRDYHTFAEYIILLDIYRIKDRNNKSSKYRTNRTVMLGHLYRVHRCLTPLCIWYNSIYNFRSCNI